MRKAGPRFLQIPGPSDTPDRIFRAIDRAVIDRAVIDHRGATVAEIGAAALSGLKTIIKTEHPVAIYPASGAGAWEAAPVDTLSPGDRLMMAERLGRALEMLESDWRSGVDPSQIEERPRADRAHAINAVYVVHSETSIGAVGQLARLIVDTISSLASTPYEHDGLGVDVSISGSQRGLMPPSGLSFNALSPRAIAASRTARPPNSDWAWEDMLGPNASGFFPYTPATNLLYGLNEAIAMRHEEGLEAVFARHRRHAEATRIAVGARGLEMLCAAPDQRGAASTAARPPEGASADAVRAEALERYDLSLGAGLSKLSDKIFRIGHLGDFNDLMLLGALAGVEMALGAAGVRPAEGGVQAAMTFLSRPST